MTKQVDKDENFMKNEWGTQFLASEYGWESKIEKQKMLREIKNDDLTPKKHDFFHQNEIHEKFVTMRIMMTGSMEQNLFMSPKIVNK